MLSGSFKHPIGTMRHERNSNSLVGRQPLLLGSNSMSGVLGQCASNCEILPISDIMRPSTALMLSSSNLPTSNVAKGSSLSSKVSSHKKTMTATNIDRSTYVSHQQKPVPFDPSKTIWQNDNAAPAILTSGSNLPHHCQSKEDMGSGQLQQLAASSVSQATSACSVGQHHFVQLRKKEAAASRDSKGCLHAELISYKVHKDQFKSLLIPLMKQH